MYEGPDSVNIGTGQVKFGSCDVRKDDEHSDTRLEESFANTICTATNLFNIMFSPTDMVTGQV